MLDIDKIIAFEEGTIAEDDLIDLFQDLVDSGQAWTLQGFYGRAAVQLIAQGLVEVKDESSLPPMAVSHIESLRGEHDAG